MNFGQAIEELRKGNEVRREGWNGAGIFIKLNYPIAINLNNPEMTQPFIYIDTTRLKTTNPKAPKGRVPWLASQTDMLADDWEVVETV